MSAVLLAPHNDDETLFAAFTCLVEHPHIVVCLASAVQEARGTGVTAEQRQAETAAAAEILGCTWEQWEGFDDGFGLSLKLAPCILSLASEYERCYAPAVEEGGHRHHNLVGELALDIFGPSHVTCYLTYTSRGRSTSGNVVVPAEPSHIAAKLRALACHETQIANPDTRPHFLGSLYEYRA